MCISSSALNDLMGEKEASFSPPLSFADEIKLLVSSDEVKTSMSDSKPLRHVQILYLIPIFRLLTLKNMPFFDFLVFLQVTTRVCHYKAQF